jgi:DNA topoisomerase-3
MPPRRQVLHVAEKPAVAKELAAVLSGGQSRRRQGPSQYNCIWEFNSDFQGIPSVPFHVTSVTGHLMYDIDSCFARVVPSIFLMHHAGKWSFPMKI